MAEHLQEKLEGQCGNNIVLSVYSVDDCLSFVGGKYSRELVEPISTSANKIARVRSTSDTYASRRSSCERATKFCTNSSAIVPYSQCQPATSQLSAIGARMSYSKTKADAVDHSTGLRHLDTTRLPHIVRRLDLVTPTRFHGEQVLARQVRSTTTLLELCRLVSSLQGHCTSDISGQLAACGIHFVLAFR